MLFLTIFSLLIFASTYKNNNLTSKISSLTNLSTFAYSNNIFENRIFEYQDKKSELLFLPLQIHYLAFTYEK